MTVINPDKSTFQGIKKMYSSCVSYGTGDKLQLICFCHSLSWDHSLYLCPGLCVHGFHLILGAWNICFLKVKQQ